MAVDKQITIFDSENESHHQNYKLSVEELQSELSKFNLTSNQAKIYIFLGKYGSRTAPEVCKALKIARTETYHLLSTLQSKGIVSATFEHPIKFSALSLDKAMKTLLNAERERIKTLEKHEHHVSKLWENIPEFLQNIEEKENKFQMLQGANSISGKLTDMVSSAKNEILVLGSEKDHMKFYHNDLLTEMVNSKVESKILTSCSEKTNYVFEDMKKDSVRKMEAVLDKNLCFIIGDDEEMIFFTKNNSYPAQEIMAMWTDSASMIYSMKLLFDFIWLSSKSI